MVPVQDQTALECVPQWQWMDQGVTYRHRCHLLISSLTPGIVDQAFLSSFQVRHKLGC